METEIKKIYFDHNFVEDLYSLRNENKHFKFFYEEIITLSEKSLLKIYYSVFHIYEYLKGLSIGGDKYLELITEKLKFLKKLTNNNYIDVIEYPFKYSEEDPINLFNNLKIKYTDLNIKNNLLPELKDMIKIDDKYKIDENIFEKIEDNLINLNSDIDEEKQQEIGKNQIELSFNNIKESFIKSIPENFPFKDMFLNLFENMKSFPLAMLNNSSGNNKELDKGFIEKNIDDFLKNNPNFKNLKPGFYESILQAFSYFPDNSKTQKRKETDVDTYDSLHLNCACLCDVVVTRDVKFFERINKSIKISNNNLKAFLVRSDNFEMDLKNIINELK